MAIRTPNFVLTRDFSFPMGKYDSKVIPSGSFVRPIETTYVPKHVLEDPRWAWFQEKTEIFCYTYFGMIPIPKSYMRET